MNLQDFVTKVIVRGVRVYHVSEGRGDGYALPVPSSAAPDPPRNPIAVPDPPTRGDTDSRGGNLLFRYADESDEPGGRPCMLDMAAPTTVYDAKSGGINDECPICIEVFEPNHAVKTLPCGHVMHETCSKTWFLGAPSAAISMTCPVCRQNWCDQ